MVTDVAGVLAHGDAERNVFPVRILVQEFAGEKVMLPVHGILHGHAVGQIDPRARGRQEGGGDIVYRLLASQVDGHVHVAQEALPAAVAIGPAAQVAVREGSRAGGGIIPVPRPGISDFRPAAEMVLRLPGGRAVAHLLLQLERGVSALAERRGMGRRPLTEVVRILHVQRTPADFRDGKCARIQHVFRMGRLRDEFVPEIALYAQQMSQGGLGNACRRVIDIDAVDGQVAAPAFRLADRRVLNLVQVATVARCHHGVVPLPDGLEAALGPPPRHDRGVRGQAAFQDLVPADEPASVGVQEPLDAAHQVALELFHVFQPLFLHPALTVRTVVPMALPGLVATDMDILRREQVHHLGKHIFQQLERRFLAGAQVIREIPTAYAGNGIHRFAGMAGHLDLRDDSHVVPGRIGDDFADVLLRQETAVGAFISLAGRVPFPPGIPHPPGSLRRELGVRLDLQPPAGGIGQMEVQHIELDLRKSVDLLENELLVPEMPGNVQHDAPPGESGIVDDHAAGVRIFQLSERRLGAIHAFGRIRLDPDTLGSDGQPVCFFLRKVRKGRAPAGEGALAHNHLQVLRGRRAIGPLERNGRRENPKRHDQSKEGLHQIRPPFTS